MQEFGKLYVIFIWPINFNGTRNYDTWDDIEPRKFPQNKFYAI